MSRWVRVTLVTGAAITFCATVLTVVLGVFSVLGPVLATWLACGFGVVCLGLVVAMIVLRRRLWPPSPEKLAHRRMRRAIAAKLRSLRRAARAIDRDPLKVPRLIVLAPPRDAPSTTMPDLAFAPVDAAGTGPDAPLPDLTLLSSQTAVALQLQARDATDDPSGAAEALFAAMAAERPLQPANAVVVELPLDALLAPGESTSVAAMSRLLAAATERFGTDLPIHVMLCGLDLVPDLTRAAHLGGAEGEPLLRGSFLLDDGPLPERLAELFEGMRRQLGQCQTAALRGQLDADFSADIVTAPFQLSLIEDKLSAALAALVTPLPPRTRPHRIASIGFVGRTGEDAASGLDPLGAIMARKYLHSSVGRRDVALPGEICAENAAQVAAVLHKEAFAAAPNARRLIRRKVIGAAASVTLGAVLLGATLGVGNATLKAREIDREVARTFDGYYHSVDTLDPGADTLVDRVLLLDTLGQALGRYDALERPVLSAFLIGEPHRDFYTGVYHDELAQGLQFALADQLEKNIFAFNALADPVALLDLERVKTRFFGDQAAHLEPLRSYFTQTMVAQGEVSAAFLAAFERVSTDLFTLNRPLESSTAELDTVVADTLQGGDLAALLYEALLARPEMKARVDLTEMIGPRFAAVFALPEDAVAQYVPRAFTRAGFADMFTEGEISGMTPLIDDYAAVIGPLNATARNAIARKVRQLYVTDYIARWSDFLSLLEFRRAGGWVDGQRLIEALTTKTDNPIDRLDAMLSENLSPAPAAPAGAETGEENAAAPTGLAATSAAANIAGAFKPYVAAAGTDDSETSAFGLFLERSRAVGDWMRKAGTHVGGAPAFLFAEHAALGDRPNPLADLHVFAGQTDLPVLASFARELAATLDASASSFIAEHIDAAWSNRIVAPWRPLVAGRFPFDTRAAADFPLKDLPALFGPEGDFAMFEASYLAGFRDAGGSFAPRPSFVPGGRIALSDRAAAMFRRVAAIRTILLAEGKPGVAFRLRARHLDSSLSEVRVSAGTTLYRYRHGPPQWSDQTWPDAGIGDSGLQTVLFARGRPQQSVRFTGPWAWFRLAVAGGGRVDPSGGNVLSVIGPSGEQAVLEFGTELTENPFSAGFLGGLTIPDTLFDPASPYMAAEARP